MGRIGSGGRAPPRGGTLRGPMEVVLAYVVIGLIPSLLVGHLALRWRRDRMGWTILAVLVSWPLALAALLIAGRKD